MKMKTCAAAVALLLSANCFASPLETIPLDAFAVVNGNTAHDVSLDKLTDIPYNLFCTINNSTGNDSLPLEFFPKKGAVGYIKINGQDAGNGDTHHVVNIPLGDSIIEMNNVIKGNNKAAVVKNNSADASNAVTITECHASS